MHLLGGYLHATLKAKAIESLHSVPCPQLVVSDRQDPVEYLDDREIPT